MVIYLDAFMGLNFLVDLCLLLGVAGSPRNSFRASVGYEFHGGKALNGLGADKVTEPYQTKNAV